MKILDVIATANRNLGRSKLRTFLTASAIFVGAFTLSLTTALGTGAQQYLERQLGNVTAPGVFFVGPPSDAGNPFAGSGDVTEYNPEERQGSGFSTLTNVDIDKLREVKGIESVTPGYQLVPDYITLGSSSKKFAMSSLTQDVGLNFDLSAGTQVQKDRGPQIVLPEKYLKPLGFNTPQDAVGKRATIGYKTLQQRPLQITATITGVLKKSFITEGAAVVNDQVARTIAEGQGQTQAYFAVFAKFSDTDEAKEPQQKALLQTTGEYEVASLKEQISTISTVIGAITTALNVVGIIALVAASFGIINTLLMSVYERTQEIGLMKALGMHRRVVFLLFAIEAMLVGFWGSLVAVLGAYGTSLAVNQWASGSFLKDFEGFNLLVVSPTNGAMVVGIIMLVAFLAGTLPAIKASRLNPIDALRSE